MTTNRQFILNCINGMSDDALLKLWDALFECANQRSPIITACEWCEAQHGGECPVETFACSVDATAWMQREAVLRK